MFEILNFLLIGISSFVISGLDDFIFMLLLFIFVPKHYHYGVLGIAISLTFLIVISFLTGYYGEYFFYEYYNINIIKYIAIFILIYLVYLVFNFIRKDKTSYSKLNLPTKLKESQQTKKEIMFYSGFIYFMQGLDDFIVYSGMFVQLSINKSIVGYVLYIIGIYIGLMIFWWGIIKFSNVLKNYFKVT